MQPKYQRILLKISGESLAGAAGHGFDAHTIEAIAGEIAEISRLGTQTAVVVGGGNIWRGLKSEGFALDRSQADQMGMLATVLNALALSAAITAAGVPSRVLTAQPLGNIAEPYTWAKAMQYLEAGEVLLFAGGTGCPYFSTDTAASLRAAEIHADALLMAKTVDGVYNSDPKINPAAKRFTRLHYTDILNQNLKVMDSTAAAMCRDNHISILVFNITEKGNMLRAVLGEDIGTEVGGD